MENLHILSPGGPVLSHNLNIERMLKTTKHLQQQLHVAIATTTTTTIGGHNRWPLFKVNRENNLLFLDM